MASKHLAPEQENFVRLSLACVDEVRTVFGDILYSQIPAADLFKAIKSNTTLTTGSQKLSVEQLSLCYKPGPIAPNYQCFDITLLYKLIRNLCPTLQPSRGWGQKPHKTDIRIGDDVERLRIIRNEIIAHRESSSVPDHTFDATWDELENIFKRIQKSAIFKGTTKQFVEDLLYVKRTCFGWQDYERSQLRLFFESNNLTDISKPILKGDEETLCGDTACLRLTYDDGDTSNNWPVIWQRIRGKTRDPIDISTKRHKGSSSQQLVIRRATKDDEGEYRATALREVKGTSIEIPSNSIHLKVIGDLPCLGIENALSEEDGISIHYIVRVDDQSPPVESIVWTKDGKPLETNTDKYSGGEVGDTYFKIHSPTFTDIGQYSCEVSNAVGLVKKPIDLDVPSISIDGDPEVTFGKDIAITGTIHSRPTPVSVLWQKDDSLDFENFKILDINDSKYYGSKDDPEDPKLVIQKTTHDDGQYYRLVVSNRIGESTSNTSFLKLLGDVPSLSVHHHANIEERSVTLICEITLPIHSPEVMDFYWTKGDKKIDIAGSGGKYTGGGIADPSLSIKSVTLSDKGKYQCCASNLIGNKRSEAIELDLPVIKFDKPHLDEGEKATYSASIISIPVPYSVEWKVRQDPNGDFRALYIHDPLYRGSSVALPHPTLVVNKYKAEEQQSFQLEVHNFIGSSQKSTKDIAVERSNVGINQEVLNPSKEFYSKRGSGLMFAKLSDDLAMAVPENKLKRLKHFLFGYNNVDKGDIKKVKSVRELFMLLQEKNLFTETDVLFVQILLKQAGCETLSEKCYQYAEKQKALCYFEKPPENGFIEVRFHVKVPLELYSPKEREDIKETVIAFLGCGKEDVYIQKISPDNSFIIVFAIKQKYSNKIAHIDHKHIQKLHDLKVDYFVFDNERYSTEDRLKDMSLSHKTDLSAKLIHVSRITVPVVNGVRHICVVTSDRLWVSDVRGRLLQVDSTGHVLHDELRDKIGPWLIGSHTVTEDGDILFIDNNDKVCKLTSDGTVTTLLTTDRVAYCIHSSRINGDILMGSSLVGSPGRVTRYDRTGRELQVIERDDEGQSLYGWPLYITENQNGDILISDMINHTVVAVDKLGRHRFDYTGRQSDYKGRQSDYKGRQSDYKGRQSDYKGRQSDYKGRQSDYTYYYTGQTSDISPRGICTDVLGHVLVCDEHNNNVHLLDQDGQFLSLLLTPEQHEMHGLTALCVDDKQNLYLGQLRSNMINVYKYLQGQ